MNSWLKSIILIIAGGGIGAAISLSIAASRPLDARELASLQAAPPAQARDPKLAQLEARLRRLESRPEASSAQAQPPATDTDTPDEEVTAEEGKEAFWQSVRASVEAHNAEPLDPQWASKTNGLLSADLTKLSQSNHFTVDNVDCRNTTCLVGIEWTSQATAVQEYSALLHEGYRANCARSLVLDQEALPNGRQRATMLLDCESWRVDGEPTSGPKEPALLEPDPQ